jgi:hypothetical protein
MDIRVRRGAALKKQDSARDSEHRFDNPEDSWRISEKHRIGEQHQKPEGWTGALAPGADTRDGRREQEAIDPRADQHSHMVSFLLSHQRRSSIPTPSLWQYRNASLFSALLLFPSPFDSPRDTSLEQSLS